ncbi:MAG: hypothetical protein JWR07_3260 [Nevskia sp.]|nr:hypothetical protein [Nevskia sp.]
MSVNAAARKIITSAPLRLRDVSEQVRDTMRRYVGMAAAWTRRIAPHLLTAAALLGGAFLTLSTLGGERGRHLSEAGLPHDATMPHLGSLCGSAAGIGMLILARGLYLRLDGAWWVATALACASFALAAQNLAFDWIVVCAGVTGMLWAVRRHYFRRSVLLGQRVSLAGVAVIAATVTGFIAVARSDIQYAQEAWWRFALDHDAPRFLRAAIPFALLAASTALWRSLSPHRPRPVMPDAATVQRANNIAAGSSDPLVRQAALGNMQLFFAGTGDAFIMYRQSGRCVIALGDPVGKQERFEDLLWSFRELCDRNLTQPVFYRIGDEWLPLYLDLGLKLERLAPQHTQTPQPARPTNPRQPRFIALPKRSALSRVLPEAADLFDSQQV